MESLCMIQLKQSPKRLTIFRKMLPLEGPSKHNPSSLKLTSRPISELQFRNDFFGGGAYSSHQGMCLSVVVMRLGRQSGFVEKTE